METQSKFSSHQVGKDKINEFISPLTTQHDFVTEQHRAPPNELQSKETPSLFNDMQHIDSDNIYNTSNDKILSLLESLKVTDTEAPYWWGEADKNDSLDDIYNDNGIQSFVVAWDLNKSICQEIIANLYAGLQDEINDIEIYSVQNLKLWMTYQNYRNSMINHSQCNLSEQYLWFGTSITEEMNSICNYGFKNVNSILFAKTSQYHYNVCAQTQPNEKENKYHHLFLCRILCDYESIENTMEANDGDHVYPQFLIRFKIIHKPTNDQLQLPQQLELPSQHKQEIIERVSHYYPTPSQPKAAIPKDNACSLTLCPRSKQHLSQTNMSWYNQIGNLLLDETSNYGEDFQGMYDSEDEQIIFELQQIFEEEAGNIPHYFYSNQYEIAAVSVTDDPNSKIMKCATPPPSHACNQPQSNNSSNDNGNKESSDNNSNNNNGSNGGRSNNFGNGNGNDDGDDKNNNYNQNNMMNISYEPCTNPQCSAIIEQQQKLILQQRVEMEQQRMEMEHKMMEIQQQKQFIEALQASNQQLLGIISQTPSALNRNGQNYQHKDPIKQEKKNRKRQKKAKQNEVFVNRDNNPSYDPSPSRRAGRGNINIPKTMTQDIVPSKVNQKVPLNWYKYMEKAIAMQLNDHSDCMENEMIAIDYDFHDKKTQEKLYCIIEMENESNTNSKYRWKMHQRLYTVQQIKRFEVEVPKSSRSRLQKELQQIGIIKDLLNQKFEQIMNVKWWNISIFRRNNNKQRMVLCLKSQCMNGIMKEVKKCKSHRQLIPIIMFNNHNHWIEWILIVQIVENVNIGISLIYHHSDNILKITGIHLDKQYLLEQHILISPQHVDECKCFDNWSSHITDIKISGNLDDDDNKIKDYKQRYETLKTFIYQFIEESSVDDYESVKQRASILMKRNNGRLENKSNVDVVDQSSLMDNLISISPSPTSSSSSLLMAQLSSNYNSSISLQSQSQSETLSASISSVSISPHILPANVMSIGLNNVNVYNVLNANSNNTMNVNGYNDTISTSNTMQFQQKQSIVPQNTVLYQNISMNNLYNANCYPNWS